MGYTRRHSTPPVSVEYSKAYDGPKGSDPTGRGFVVEILDATGPSQRRRYKPKWKTEEWVPITAAEDGWYARLHLVGTARELADAFDRQDTDEDDGAWWV